MYYWSALLAFATVGVGLLPLRVVAAVVGAGALLAVAVAVLPRLAGRGSSGSGTPSVR